MTHGLIHQILFSKQEKEKRNEQLRKEMEAAWEYSERVRRYQVAKEAIVSLTKRLSDYQLMRTELERQRDRVIKQYAKEVELFAMMGVECILRRPAASDAELNGRDAVCQRPAGLRY